MTDDKTLVERLRAIAIMDVHKDSRIAREVNEAADHIEALTAEIERLKKCLPTQ